MNCDTRQLGKSVLAGVCLPNGDGPILPGVVTIEYRYRCDCWHLQVEHSINQRNELIHGLLPELIPQFEEMLNVKLPVVKTCHLGVGIYPAHSGEVEENPCALVDGQHYRVQDKKYGWRNFVAEIQNGRALTSFIRDGEVYETTIPRSCCRPTTGKEKTRRTSAGFARGIE
ncbi:hypothetical protein [Caballeronia grimmiae]|uniref:hypothetical protein n=1 Tax=Caballeronia grimmiae TaxID=1071679 RepID=UPI0038BB4CD8